MNDTPSAAFSEVSYPFLASKFRNNCYEYSHENNLPVVVAMQGFLHHCFLEHQEASTQNTERIRVFWSYKVPDNHSGYTKKMLHWFLFFLGGDEVDSLKQPKEFQMEKCPTGKKPAENSSGPWHFFC